MVTQPHQLEEYEQQIAQLLDEIGKYKATGQTLRDMAVSLESIQSTNLVAGRALSATATDLAQTLETIDGLKLDELTSRSAAQYVDHQKALESLGVEIRDAVREQQRLGLEMMQQAAASQRQFDGFLAQFKTTTDDLHHRLDATHSEVLASQEKLRDHSRESLVHFQQTDSRVDQIRILGIVTIVLAMTLLGIALFG